MQEQKRKNIQTQQLQFEIVIICFVKGALATILTKKLHALEIGQ